MKHFHIDWDKDICAFGFGIILNDLYDRKYEHRLSVILLGLTISFSIYTDSKIGK